jgi:thioredoxin-like negative regulator of GroEL
VAVGDFLPLCALLACVWGVPASAQTDPIAQLDALVDATSKPGSGMTLARSQIADGELTGAVATLERVLMNDPTADDALLLHASLLCRLDDSAGARAEIAEIKSRVPDRGWSEVTASCGPMPRPKGRSGR